MRNNYRKQEPAKRYEELRTLVLESIDEREIRNKEQIFFSGKGMKSWLDCCLEIAGPIYNGKEKNITIHNTVSGESRVEAAILLANMALNTWKEVYS